MPIDEDVRQLLEASKDSFPSTGDPWDVRTRCSALPVGALPGIWRIEDIDIPNADSFLRLRVYSSSDEQGVPAILVFHGGGWVIGDLMWTEGQCRQLSAKTQCRVISVEYRLAPEARFPAAAEDAYTALEWVAENSARLRIDPERIAAYGQSAGGNLVAALALMTRDRSGPSLRSQVLAYPVIDADFDRGSYKEWGDGPGLTRSQMEWFWDNYVDAADRCNPYVSPLYAETFAGVAPALVITAEADPLQDEGEAYAQRLHDDGIPVVHTMYPGMHHGFLNLTQLFPKAQEAFDEVVASLRSSFGID